MAYLDYNEPIHHSTGEMPLAHYYVDEHHPRYHMRMHWHRETELLRMRSGTLRLYVDGAPLSLSEGDAVLLGEGALHGSEAESGVYECIVFDPRALLPLGRNPLKGILGSTILLKNGAIAADEALKQAMDRLYDSVHSEEVGAELRITGALYGLFAELLRRNDDRLSGAASERDVKAEHLKPALEYIEQNYDSRITLETLSRLTGFSPKYFCRCFRAVFHRSPIDYLNHYRIECASTYLLTTDKTVAEIAQLCGFADSSFFIKQFKKYKNTTPKHYGDQFRGAD